MGNYTAVYDVEDLTELTTSGLGQTVIIIVSLVSLMVLIALGVWMWTKGKGAVGKI